ncbi:MAG: tail fiber domain-containing protein, partial [Bacteroidales bacterium]|nr:tail fiber domain-containing protein [Bacteroidales bacterium]
MKKSVLLNVFICIAISINAQIKVESNGNIGIGKSSASSKVDIKANNIKFDTRQYLKTGSTVQIDDDSYDIKLDYSLDFISHPGVTQNWPCFYPSRDRGAYLGHYSYRWNGLYVNNVNYISLSQTSDKSAKENIKSFKGALEAVTSIQGVKYDYKKECLLKYDSAVLSEKDLRKVDEMRKNKVGFIAQDVKEFIPEAVSFDST